MDVTHQSQTASNDENIINILVIQHNDDSVPTSPQDMRLSRNTHFSERQFSAVASPILRDYEPRDSLPSYQSKENIPPKRTPEANSIPRPTLYKSQSFTVGQSHDKNKYLGIAAVKKTPVFNTSFPLRNINVQSSHLENTTSFNMAPVSQIYGQSKRFIKHKSVNIPINHSVTNTLSPALFVKDLGQSTINSLTTTPDSGFCTPNSGINNESFPLASSTPRSSRVGSGGERVGFGNPVALSKAFSEHGDIENVGLEEESPLDKSLNSAQWLQTYCIGSPLTHTTSPSSQSAKPVETSSCNNPIVQVPLPSMPLLNFTATTSSSPQTMSSSCNVQKRVALQEFNGNACIGQVTGTESQKSQYERPSYSYMDLIKMALKHSENGQLTLREILAWIENHFPYFKYKAKQSWKSSVRCNLSLHSDFTKVEDKKRGGKWKVIDDAKSYMHRLPKPPVIKHPIGPKVPAMTRLKSRRSGPLPILPKSVPYALVPLPLAAFEQGNQAHNIQQQALHIWQQHQHPVIQLPIQVQQILNRHQQQGNFSASQQLSSSSLSSPQQTKPGLQQLAPKLQQHPASIVWNLRTEEERTNEHQPVPFSYNIQPGLETNNYKSLNTSSKKEGNCHPHPCTLDQVLQPVDIQIHQGNQLNEKKIVFYLKQQPDQNQFKVVTSPASTKQSGLCNSEDKQLSHTSWTTSSKARSVCKSGDKIQRSKSFDIGCRNIHISPYCKGRKEDSGNKAPLANLAILFKEHTNKTIGKMLSRQDDDDEGLMVDLSPEIPHTSVKPLTSRPESAPTKCLIQQAWDQAGTISECDFLSSSIREQGNAHAYLSTDLEEIEYPSFVLPKKSTISALCGYQGNKHNIGSNVFSQHTESADHQSRSHIFQPIDIPKVSVHTSTSSMQLEELDKISCRQANIRNESTRSTGFLTKSNVISKCMDSKKMQAIHVDRTAGLESGRNLSNAQEKQNTASLIASETMSASKVVFCDVPISCHKLNSSAFAHANQSVATIPLSLNSSQCPPQPRFYRTKSRRKQIHTPLTTDIYPDRVKTVSPPSTPKDERNDDQPKLNLNVDAAEAIPHNATDDNFRSCLTPSSETRRISHTTSSPNSGNAAPLDFALYLSNLSSSSQMNPCTEDNANLSINQIHDRNMPPPSSSLLHLLPSRFSCHGRPAPSSVTTVSSIDSVSPSTIENEAMNVQEPSSPMSQHIIVSPQPASTSSPTATHAPPHRYMTSDPHFYPSENNFHNSSPPLLLNPSHSDVKLTSSSHTLGHFLFLTSTPPSGNQLASTSSTPTHGMHLPVEMLHVPANSSGFLDSSLFDNLDSLMQNSLYEFKTP